ncbi:hypothetical protein EB796_024831 [Bugula neritina]|uniref:Uncharacterized protein n=1 Tax=Bugula neritina TaxID=10212 RepID=A0A7J7ISI4_BUGNE|nr:hypothetical protein EB796_024831 [Bugula neritina]
MAAASTAEGQTSTMEDQTSTTEGQTSTPEGQTLSGGNTKAMAARIGLNDNKAGMKGLDKDKINKIILEASKGMYS